VSRGASPMTIIHLNLINFTHHEALSDIFDKYTKDFHTNKGLGSVKIGRYYCTGCRKSVEEDHDFWDKMKSEFSGGSTPEGGMVGMSDKRPLVIG